MERRSPAEQVVRRVDLSHPQYVRSTGINANNQSARPAKSPRRSEERKSASAKIESAEAGCLHSRLYHHAKEAQFGAAQSRTCPADQWLRGHRLHSWRRS